MNTQRDKVQPSSVNSHSHMCISIQAFSSLLDKSVINLCLLHIPCACAFKPGCLILSVRRVLGCCLLTQQRSQQDCLLAQQRSQQDCLLTPLLNHKDKKCTWLTDWMSHMWLDTPNCEAMNGNHAYARLQWLPGIALPKGCKNPLHGWTALLGQALLHRAAPSQPFAGTNNLW